MTTDALLREARFDAATGHKRHSAGEPFPSWSNGSSDITVLLFTTHIKQCVPLSPPHNCSFKLEIAFCVRGVSSPTLSNILLTPFDREMRLRGYQLTRYADDWVVTCKSAAEARAAVDAARRILKQLGVALHPQKTRIVHVRYGFEFLGYKIKRGYRKLHLPESKIRSQARQDALYAYPKEKSIRRFMDQVRQRTKRTMPLPTKELIQELNPLLRGWGEYYKRAHVRKLFQRPDGWILRRICPALRRV
ncbi:MAG TPA: reverse transcriptase domain-containing protein [Terriglobales bacterium]